jgi:hypothetical protein
VPGVLQLLCVREIQREAGGNVVHVEPTTRQIIDGDVLVALKIAEGMPTVPADFEKAEAIAHALNAGYRAEPVTLPDASRCAFTESEPSDGDMTLRLELSQPFVNPFTNGGGRTAAFIARLSLDGQAESWYFGEARDSGKGWVAERVVRLPIDE